MQLFEMQGLLAGKCLPGDMKVNESLAEYLLRKLEDRNELERQLSAKTISEQNIINAFGISGEGAHSKLVIEYVHGLVAENKALKSFGNKLDEMHNDLNGSGTGIQGGAEVACQQVALEAAMEEFDAIKTPATDDAIAEIKSEEAQTMYESILDNPSVYDMESLVDYLESYAENKKSFAANLRAGRKG
ncbi:hypothetical protein AB6896_01760 [Rahnella inusitata]|uniref:hypothetical protein n=1 Tax=Rahnella inusitata TaxID=58169 RepID=UPI0039BDEF61